MFYPSDSDATSAILACGRRLDACGFVAGNGGNISVKVSDDQFLVTPTAVQKGSMREDMLVRLNMDGEILDGHLSPSSETPMHLRIYKENPNAHAIVHAHPAAATAFACAGLPLDAAVLQEAIVLLGKVPLAPFALPGSEALADSVTPFCRDFCAILLEYHGAVTWGETLAKALERMETLEHYAMVLLHLNTLGNTRRIPKDLEQQLMTLRRP